MSQREALGPAVAGAWYPADPAALGREVEALLSRDAAAPPSRAPSALIAPHAGFAYSGAVAAAGFRLLRGRSCERVLLIGPSHYAAFRGAVVPAARRYRTPLGDVALDAEAIARIATRPGLRLDDAPFGPEHCLEAELPFLQRTLAGDWRLVPVLIGGGSPPDSLERVAEALEPLVGPQTLLVASSDFTHFGPRFGYVPFERDVPRRIRELDMGAVAALLARDRATFADYVDRTGATICGRDAIDVLLRLLRDEGESALVAYDTSGHLTGDWGHSVSYASLAFGGRGAA
jgi:AmmeMemoRadiSam system protein B